MILCEGVSTAWGVFQVLGGRALVIATLGKGNLTRCAVAARAKIGDSRQLFVMADIDANGAGQSAANDAARESRSIAIAPLLVSQSAKSRATCLFEEGGKWDGWDLWRFVGKSQVGVDGLMRLSAIHDHLLSEGRRNG